jgi:hypothetical protein
MQSMDKAQKLKSATHFNRLLKLMCRTTPIFLYEFVGRSAFRRSAERKIEDVLA